MECRPDCFGRGPIENGEVLCGGNPFFTNHFFPCQIPLPPICFSLHMGCVFACRMSGMQVCSVQRFDCRAGTIRRLASEADWKLVVKAGSRAWAQLFACLNWSRVVLVYSPVTKSCSFPSAWIRSRLLELSLHRSEAFSVQGLHSVPGKMLPGLLMRTAQV